MSPGGWDDEHTMRFTNLTRAEEIGANCYLLEADGSRISHARCIPEVPRRGSFTAS